MGFPPVPAEIKSIAYVLKVADELETRNIVVSYWARMYACLTAMKLIPDKKPPEVFALLIAIKDWLDQTKKANSTMEGISNETVAHALIKEYAMRLFNYADRQYKAENFNKNVIKAFHTAGILMDVLDIFDELSEDIQSKRKYAKWKAAYIHNCLKTGDIPTVGGPDKHLNNEIDVSQQDDKENNGEPVAGPAPTSSPATPFQPEPFIPPSELPLPKPPRPAVRRSIPSSGSSSTIVDPEKIQKAQKYCKYATSALNYDDVKNAIENLHKALNLLELGRED